MIYMTPENRQKMNDYIICSCSDAELEHRWEAASRKMKEHDVDYLIVSQRTDMLGQYVKWFTDQPVQWEYNCSVIFSQDKEMSTVWGGTPVLPGQTTPPHVPNLAPRDWCSRGITRRWGQCYFPSLDYTGTYDAKIIVYELANKGKIRVGFVGMNFLSVISADYIRTHLPNAQFVDFTPYIDEIKVIKSDEEMGYIRETCKLQDEVTEYMKGFLRPGLSEQEVYAEMKYQACKRGSENGVFLIGSAAWDESANVYEPHFHSKKVLQKGDNIAFVPECNGPSGYYCHITVTFSLGEPHPDLVKAMDAGKEAYQFLLDRLVAGVDCNRILKEYDEWMVKHGQSPETRLLGHGMGLDFVEKPAILPGGGEHIKLAPNMNFSVHPGIKVNNHMAFLAANFRITEGKPELLHKFPYDEICVID